MMVSTGAPALACVPSAIRAAERLGHFALVRELFGVRAEERVALPNGYAFRFSADAFEAVTRFVANERKCCPFMSFEVSLAHASGPLWLRMTGPEGTRDILDAELKLASSLSSACSCSEAPRSTDRAVKWTTVGGVLAALGICAACCLLPFALLSIGVAGAWVSAIDSLAKYKWVFIALTTAFLGYGFHAVYWRPRLTRAAGAAGQVCGSSRTARLGLWIATILAISGIVFEQLEPMLTGAR